MEINKQLFEDVLAGRLKGIFVKRAGGSWESKYLHKCTLPGFVKYPYYFEYGCLKQAYSETGKQCTLAGADIVYFIPDKNMKENELTIEIPDGKIVDWDESKKQNKIVLKDKQLTYEEICDRLPGMIDIPLFDTPSKDGNALVANEHYLECLLAKNMLANVAKYLNDGWKPNFSDRLMVFALHNEDDTLKVAYENSLYARGMGHTIFKLPELAKQAIEILGEETVKLALEPLGI